MSNQSSGPLSTNTWGSGRNLYEDNEDPLEKHSRLAKLDQDIEERLEKIRENLCIGKYKKLK